MYFGKGRELADYIKQISSLSPEIIRTIKKIKDAGDLAYITKVLEELLKNPSIKGKIRNKCLIRDAIIYAATKGKITINTSGKPLILEVFQKGKQYE